MDRTPKPLVVLGIIASAVLADQLSKEWALHRLSGGRTIHIAPTLEFDLTFNSGFSFGTGAGNGQIIGILVTLVCVGVAWMIAREQDLLRVITLTVILGGAVGNLIDRLFRGEGFLRGEVVDFIDVTWYAVFNVADMLVVCGCILLVLTELRKHTTEPAPTRSEV